MSDLVTSIVRTVVPALVGSIAFWLANIGIDVDEEALVALLTSVTVGVYYAAARWAEGRWAKAGWLLGAAKQPHY